MASQRDVVFTPFMLRVRELLDGTDRSAPLRLRSSTLQPFARATDEWFYLRARCEQVIAEANAMLTGRAELVDIEDEVGTGTLAQAGRQGWVELERRHARSAQPLEPEDPDVLEDLVIELLGSGRSSTDD